MIKLVRVKIVEFRGIRELVLEMDRENFMIRGPNGSGKSGVIDAVEFALTGAVSRLSGTGTAGVSLKRHAPHVNRRDDPEASRVELTVYIPALDTEVTLTRTVANPVSATLDPGTPEAHEAVQAAADHPECVLSRRELLRFILAEPGSRSKMVQTLLRLDDIETVRAALRTASNRLASSLKSAEAQEASAADILRRHLDVPELSREVILSTANTRRAVLGLPQIEELEATADVAAGVATGSGSAPSPVNRETALEEITRFLTDRAAGLDAGTRDDAEAVEEGLARLEAEPALLQAMERREFLEAGMKLAEGESECPLCGTAWDSDDLARHIAEELEHSRAAEGLQGVLSRAGGRIAASARGLIERINSLDRTAGRIAHSSSHALLAQWAIDLDEIAQGCSTVEGLRGIRERIRSGWTNAPDGAEQRLSELKDAIAALPVESEEAAATSFLLLAQERLERLREAHRRVRSAKVTSSLGKAAYDKYCEASESILVGVYEEVEKDFSEFYRHVNEGDEDRFAANLKPSQGKLDLKVDFYGKGRFSPAAYHSEGHQDGMGLCLYLALMKRVLGDNFTFALLDDVVTSVDAGHRRALCSLLKEKFPHTQFIITTHERIWGELMRSTGLIGRKASVDFRGWTVESGPAVYGIDGVWEKIEEDLEKHDVHSASAKLRRHLEFVARELAEQTRARVRMRSDDSYHLGELMPAALAEVRKLLKAGTDAAQSWGKDALRAELLEQRERFDKRVLASNAERWQINPAIHYNKWENLTPDEFRQVVSAFRTLIDDDLRCCDCGGLPYLAGGPEPDALKCACGGFNVNLTKA